MRPLRSSAHICRTAPTPAARRLQLGAAILLALAGAAGTASAQQAASGFIVLRATVLPRLQILAISPKEVQVDAAGVRQTVETIEVEGNLAYRVSVRLGNDGAWSDPNSRILIRNAQGRYEELRAGGSVTVADAEHGRHQHEVVCRVEARGAQPAADSRCDLEYEVQGGRGETFMRLSASSVSSVAATN